MYRKTTLTVGFIGLGDQGGPMAQAIAESGFELHIWARRPQTLEAVAGVPHIVETTVQKLAANCDVVCLCLTDDKDIVSLLDSGLRDGLKAGAVLVTMAPAIRQKVAAWRLNFNSRGSRTLMPLSAEEDQARWLVR